MHKVPRICLNIRADMLVGEASALATDMLVAAFSTDIVGCVCLYAAGAPDGTIVEAGRALGKLKQGSGPATCLVGRPDLAGLAGADAVIVDWQPGAVTELRETAGTTVAIGVDCGRSLANGIAADAAGADFVRFSPFFPKDGQEADAGIVDWWRESMSKPVLVGGGVEESNIEELMWSGADLIELDLDVYQDTKHLLTSLVSIGGYIRQYSE